MPIFMPLPFAPPKFTVILEDRQSRVRHFKKALLNLKSVGNIYNKLIKMPWDTNANHKTMWFVVSPCSCFYKYSKYDIKPKPYFPELKALAEFVEKVTELGGTNCVNVNLYENQFSKVGFHSDSEPIFQADYIASDIISISLGATRMFAIQAKVGNIARQVQLVHGDILTMEGLCQKFYKHALLASELPVAPRINLTFRKIIQHRHPCILAKE